MILSKFSIPLVMAASAVTVENSGFAGLPDPSSPQTIAWLCLALWGLASGLDKGLDLYKKWFKEQPDPKSTYLTVSNFKEHQDKRDADLKEIKELIKGVETQLETTRGALQKEIKDSNTEQYKARGRMHRIINSLRDSLYYLSGLMGSRGAHMKGILDRAKQGEDES